MMVIGQYVECHGLMVRVKYTLNPAAVDVNRTKGLNTSIGDPWVPLI